MHIHRKKKEEINMFDYAKTNHTTNWSDGLTETYDINSAYINNSFVHVVP